MEAVSSVSLVHGLDNFRMTVYQRVSCPSVLEIDVAIALHIPDKIALCPVDNNLCRWQIALVSLAGNLDVILKIPPWSRIVRKLKFAVN